MDNEIKDLKEIEAEQQNVIDEASTDDTSAPQTYNISSYGADYDVAGLVRRLNDTDIIIPPFQRDYVWSLSDASRFIESLLLGLPVPGVFLAKEPESNKLLVIDGQQRLKSLQFFFEGYFNPKPNQKSRRVFKLLKVQPQFEDKTYADLEESDRRRLHDSIIHATVIKQDSPEGDDTSVYHVFERLNTGGRKLTPQEIRSAIYHGGLIGLLHSLNQNSNWREIYGAESNRLKDQELVLRFLAHFYIGDQYSKPMSEFLNKFNKAHRNPSPDFISRSATLFEATIKEIYLALGKTAFRPERALNAAVFDAIMVGVATRLDLNRPISGDQLKQIYDALLADTEFKSAISEGTSDVSNVAKRRELAITKFMA